MRKKSINVNQYLRSEKQHLIDIKTREILNFLDLEPSNNRIVQLNNAMKIHKYISQNSTYQQEIMGKKIKMI